MSQKQCSRCKTKKQRDQFGKDSSCSDGLNRRCKQCVKEMNELYRSKDRERFNKINRESLKRRRKEKYSSAKPEGGTCTKCNQQYDSEGFYKNKNSSTGRDSWCRKCRLEYIYEYNAMRKYGLSSKSLSELTEAAGGKCAICKTETKLFIDHNHATGEARGLLCLSCNFGIGHFRESEENLLAAIQYLKIY